MSRTRGSSVAKFRCGVAPLRIETGRYEMIQYVMRNSFHCLMKVGSEEHVLLECPLYNDIRQKLFSKMEIPSDSFNALSNHDKICHVLSDISIINKSGKACHEILNERRKLLYG